MVSLAVFLLFAMAGFLIYSTTSDIVFNHHINYSEELLLYMLALSVYIMLSVASKRNMHIRTDFFLKRLVGDKQANHLSSAIENLLGLGIGIFLIYWAYDWWYGFYHNRHDAGWHLEAYLPLWFHYTIARMTPLIGLSILSFFYFERLINQIFKPYARSQERLFQVK